MDVRMVEGTEGIGDGIGVPKRNRSLYLTVVWQSLK